MFSEMKSQIYMGILSRREMNVRKQKVPQMLKGGNQVYNIPEMGFGAQAAQVPGKISFRPALMYFLIKTLPTDPIDDMTPW